MGAPTHLFTKEEIAAEMRRADDRVTNRLIIDENGYAKVLQNINRRLSPYPVSHEAWDAGNVYVGKYSKLSTLNDNYIASLQGWLDYLKQGRRNTWTMSVKTAMKATSLLKLSHYIRKINSSGRLQISQHAWGYPHACWLVIL